MVQGLLGTMSLNQSIPAAEAATLPGSVTGGGLYGTQPGRQLVIVRIYGPLGGTLSDITLDGKQLDVDIVELAGRPVALLVAELSGPDDVLVNWSMRSGKGQTGKGEVDVTPGIVPSNKNSSFVAAC
jgi:hypothetical protein